LVDSCIETASGRPAALGYLKNLGIDLGSAVKLIVVTHWHDDHVRGLGTVVEQCREATIALSAALQQREFIVLTQLYQDPAVARTSGLRELIKVMEVLAASNTSASKIDRRKLALVDRVLLQDKVVLSSIIVPASIHALSPSDASVLKAIASFSRIAPGP